ncbi:MAG TPA: GNAT family N-acetyltransferase, partial [Novosphingobium sp.]|nr:GNAT family N-acetyltransferase [Novosphingobium sp.]
MTAITMRKAAASDLPAIVALLADDPLGQGRESAGGPLDQGYRDAFAALDASPDQLLAVAELDGKVVGT